MNAFEIYSAAFDSANDYAVSSPEYVMDYAENGLGVTISREVAEKICAAYIEFEASAQDSDSFWTIVRQPLEEIEG